MLNLSKCIYWYKTYACNNPRPITCYITNQYDNTRLHYHRREFGTCKATRNAAICVNHLWYDKVICSWMFYCWYIVYNHDRFVYPMLYFSSANITGIFTSRGIYLSMAIDRYV